MASTGKQKFNLDKDINPFAEYKGKEPPAWLYEVPAEAKKLKTLSFKRQMLLDPRKWKMKDLEDGCYAVARFELALFATQVSKTEGAIVKTVNAQTKKKYKKIEDIVSMEDLKKNKTVAKVFQDGAKEVVKNFEAISKKIEDKVGIALDEVEADKGDNKKSLSSCKDALRKFGMIDFKAAFRDPSATAASALSSLATTLKNPSEGTNVKDALDAALKSLKDAETSFEKVSKKAGSTVNVLADLGDRLAGDKNSDPAMRELGALIDDKTQTGKALEQMHDDLEDMAAKLDNVKNMVAAGLKKDDNDAAMKKLGMDAEREAKELRTNAGKYIGNYGTVATGLKKFESEFKKVQKELK